MNEPTGTALDDKGTDGDATVETAELGIGREEDLRIGVRRTCGRPRRSRRRGHGRNHLHAAGIRHAVHIADS